MFHICNRTKQNIPLSSGGGVGSVEGGWELDIREGDRSHTAPNYDSDRKIPLMSLCDDGNNGTLNDIKCCMGVVTPVLSNLLEGSLRKL